MRKVLVLGVVISLSVSNTSYASVYQSTTERSWYLGGNMYKYSDGECIKDSSGKTGWTQYNGKWYYLHNGIARNHPLMENKTMYYFKSNGEWLEPGTKEYDNYKGLLEQLDFAVKHRINDFSLQVDGYDVADYANLVDSYIGMYANNYCRDPLLLGISFDNEGIKYEYESSQELVLKHLVNIDNNMKSIVSEVNKIEDESEKIRYINNRMLALYNYDYTLQNKGSDLLSASLNNNNILCFGYACIFKDICSRVGLNAEIINGKTPYGIHSWNSVIVNGEKKYVDICWNETAKTNETYLLISEEEMNRDHFEDKTLKIAYLDKK